MDGLVKTTKKDITMDSEILPKGFDCYKRDVAHIAEVLGSKAIFKFTKDFKLYVYIEGVFIPGVSGFLFGAGTTFDDACCDFMRKVRGATIKNAINDREGNFI